MTNKTFIFDGTVLREYAKMEPHDYPDHESYMYAIADYKAKAKETPALTLPLINPPSDWEKGQVKTLGIDFNVFAPNRISALPDVLINYDCSLIMTNAKVEWVAIPIVNKDQNQEQEWLDITERIENDEFTMVPYHTMNEYFDSKKFLAWAMSTFKIERIAK